jgi:hypothetical protein
VGTLRLVSQIVLMSKRDGTSPHLPDRVYASGGSGANLGTAPTFPLAGLRISPNVTARHFSRSRFCVQVQCRDVKSLQITRRSLLPSGDLRLGTFWLLIFCSGLLLCVQYYLTRGGRNSSLPLLPNFTRRVLVEE